MKILAIDTATNVCSVAVLEDTTVLGHKTIDDEKTHSQKLMPMLEDLLSSLHLSLKDIDLFGIDIGPGSFTGIRIGIATVKAFADVYNKPICGISSLESFAYSAGETSAYICSLLDAKHDNVYYGIFEYKDNKYIPVKDFAFANISDVIEVLKTLNNSIIFTRKC